MTAEPFGLPCHRCEEGIVADGSCMNCGTSADDAAFGGGQGRDAAEIEETGGVLVLVAGIAIGALVIAAAWAVIG